MVKPRNGLKTKRLRTYPKTVMSHRMLAQANWTKANQLVDFLHHRVRTLRRLASQPKVRSTTQRRAGFWLRQAQDTDRVLAHRVCASV